MKQITAAVRKLTDEEISEYLASLERLPPSTESAGVRRALLTEQKRRSAKSSGAEGLSSLLDLR